MGQVIDDCQMADRNGPLSLGSALFVSWLRGRTSIRSITAIAVDLP